MSILTLQGRIHVPDLGYRRHVALLQAGATIGGAKLWYDRGKQPFYLVVSLTLDTPDPPRGAPAPGARRRRRVSARLSTVATLENDAQFFSGKEK